MQALEEIKGRQFTYEAIDTGDESKLGALMAVKEIQLKVGAQVLLIVNMREESRSLVNGSRGVVLAFVPEQYAERFYYLHSHGKLSYWNEIVEDYGGGSKEAHDELEERLGEDYEDIVRSARTSNGLVPLVDFKEAGIYCLGWRDFKVEVPEGYDAQGQKKQKVLATRKQLPYILSYALSVHKAQGQTIDRLYIDLGSTFEYGQAYVAVSRATHSDRLQVVRFNPGKVMTDPTVVEFYKRLERL
jgi:ATP-dependent DNA helicase PIF1